MTEIIEILKYILPMFVLAAIVYFLLDKVWDQENERRNLELRLKNKDLITPQRLQAYERLALFLERIRPTNLVRRVPLTENIDLYEHALVKAIQEEFDHNLSQQIYIHPETWKIIFSAKNATQNFLKQCRISVGEEASSEVFRDEIIRKSLEGSTPSNSALLKLQSDVQGSF